MRTLIAYPWSKILDVFSLVTALSALISLGFLATLRQIWSATILIGKSTIFQSKIYDL